jgi:hypothetical protein
MPPSPSLPVKRKRCTKTTSNNISRKKRSDIGSEKVKGLPSNQGFQQQGDVYPTPNPTGTREVPTIGEGMDNLAYAHLRHIDISGVAPSTKATHEEKESDTGRGRKVSGKNNQRLPRNPWKENPDFHWAVCAENPALQRDFMPSVLEGIKTAAAKYKLQLHKDDLNWLELHGGHFEQFIHPGSKRGNETAETKAHKGMSEQALDALLSEKKHQRFLPSPRFKHRTNKQANTEQGYETFLKQFWNFLAMTGFYEDMLILLARHPRNAPSVTDSHVA